MICLPFTCELPESEKFLIYWTYLDIGIVFRTVPCHACFIHECNMFQPVFFTPILLGCVDILDDNRIISWAIISCFVPCAVDWHHMLRGFECFRHGQVSNPIWCRMIHVIIVDVMRTLLCVQSRVFTLSWITASPRAHNITCSFVRIR